MKTLELKHIIPYADKGCNYSSREGTIITFDCEDLADIQNHIKDYEGNTWQDNYKLHLKPLSDLTEHAAKVLGIYSLKQLLRLIKDEDIPMHIYIELLEGHYDVFGLIPQGLAIDKSTIK